MIHGQSNPQHGLSAVHPLLQLQQHIANHAVARMKHTKRRKSEDENASARQANRLMRLPRGMCSASATYSSF
jgi:hypothetical protein